MAQRFPWNPPAWPSWIMWHWNGRADNSDYSSLGWRRQQGLRVIPPPEGVTVGEQQELYDAVWHQLKKHRLFPSGMVTQYQVAMEIANELATIRDAQHTEKIRVAVQKHYAMPVAQDDQWGEVNG